MHAANYFQLLLLTANSVISLREKCEQQSFNSSLTKYRYNLNKICDCSYSVCIRKCCNFGYYAIKGYCVKDNNITNFQINVHKKEHLLYSENDTKKFSIGVMNCEFYVFKNEFYVQNNGDLWVPAYEKMYPPDQYCVDNIESRNLKPFLCFLEESEDAEVSSDINVLGMIISMPFLLATFIAYALLPDRNLHMKALMFYVISLLLGYIFLVTIQLYPGKFEKISCATLAYLCIFFFILSFFWMNVICVDIWFTFSGLRGFSGSKSSERRRFYYYCAYAWGASLAHILILTAIDRFDTNISEWYHPNIGNGQCFLKNGYPELLYFYLPMAILIGVNITLFALTAWKIRNVKKETKMLKKDENKRHDSYERDKQKFNLYLKLLFAMGVNWSMEIISWAVNWNIGTVSHVVWYFTDFCNAAYGVFIFFIFVFKKSTWKLLKKRYYSFIGKPFTAHSIHTTNTRTTSVSAPNGSMHEMTTNATLTNNSE